MVISQFPAWKRGIFEVAETGKIPGFGLSSKGATLMRTPSLRKHVSGQARVTLNGRDFLLGPYGSPESVQAYHKILAEWEAAGRSPLFRQNKHEVTVAEIAEAFVKHCRSY